MVARVRAWLAEGREVRIVTARVASTSSQNVRAEQRRRITEWCCEHLGAELPITSEKDDRMVVLWDDRVVAVPRNGLPEATFECGRCGAAGEFSERWQICKACAEQVYGASDPAVLVCWLLRALGQNVQLSGLRGTPKRVANMLRELLTPESFEFTTFPSEGMSEMVIQAPVPFSSLCEHHMLPFIGTAAVAYIPNGRIVGLSKLVRAVKYCAAGLQNQERITTAIADMLEERLCPLGVGVVLRARHLCMEVRGVRAPDVYTTTSCLRGAFFDKPEARAEFLRLVR